jgi:hypothetical protein
MPFLLWLWLLRQSTTRPPRHTLAERYAALPAGPGGSRIYWSGTTWRVFLPHVVTHLETCITAEFSGESDPGISGLYWELLRGLESDHA